MQPTLINEHEILIPAGTTQANPVVNAFINGNSIIERISWVFPSGCNGVVGIQIGARSVTIFPVNRAHWFVRSGSVEGVSVEDMPNAGDWSVIGYNTGSFDHTVHVAFTYRPMRAADPIPGYLVADLVGSMQGGE